MEEKLRSLELSLDQYDSDKINSRYLEQYDPVLKPYLEKEITLLELGILNGGSLLLWRDYFPLARIVGIDIKLPKNFTDSDRIQMFEGSQADPEFLTSVAEKTAPDGFDIIIDDASHIGELTKTSFWHLFDNHLKPGGLYVIEDWGTGYWNDWPDGKNLNLASYIQSQFKRTNFWLFLTKIKGKLGIKFPMQNHCYGMVGLIKQLVDEQAAHDITRASSKGVPKRKSKFENLLITPSIAFIKKSLIPQNQPKSN